MQWIVPAEKDTANEALENRLWDSAMPGLNRNQAYSPETMIPPVDLLTQFCLLADDFERQTSILCRQKANLRWTFDLLLPRLLAIIIMNQMGKQ